MCKADRMISLAALQAQLSEMRQGHGAVLVAGGKVLGVGMNENRHSRSAMAAGICSIHAEVNALSCFKPGVTIGSFAAEYASGDAAQTSLSLCQLQA
eukprot:tig00021348_g20584.t1